MCRRLVFHGSLCACMLRASLGSIAVAISLLPHANAPRVCAANKELLLFDGHYLLFRSFYAMPRLTSSSGQPVGAVVGLCNAINKVKLPTLQLSFCGRHILSKLLNQLDACVLCTARCPSFESRACLLLRGHLLKSARVSERKHLLLMWCHPATICRFPYASQVLLEPALAGSLNGGSAVHAAFAFDTAGGSQARRQLFPDYKVISPARLLTHSYFNGVQLV